jgi:hypothetical protein
VEGKYIQLVRANNESFYAILFNSTDEVHLFQITIAENHDIKSGGLRDFHNHLPAGVNKIRFIWVLSEENQSNYKKGKKVRRSHAAVLDVEQPTVTEAGRKRIRTSNIAYENPVKKDTKVTQYRLVFTKSQLRVGQGVGGSGWDGEGGMKLAGDRIVGEIMEAVLSTKMEHMRMSEGGGPKGTFRKRLDAIVEPVRKDVLKMYSQGE